MNKLYKTCVRLLFSHVGLFFLLIGYCSLGGYMFQKIEGDDVLSQLENGTRRAKEIEHQRQLLIKQIVALKKTEHDSPQHLRQSEYGDEKSIWVGREKVRKLIEEYHRNITEARETYGYDGTVDDQPNWPWSFSSAFLFCVTIITLIGYGHVYPVTQFGQFMVIPFALLGIPLMLMYLTNVGELFASMLRFCYESCCCIMCTQRRNLVQEQYGQTKVVTADGGLHDAEGRPVGEEPTDIEETLGVKVPVPVILVAFVIVFYLVAGTILFVVWEDWNFREGLYFCFISLFTIGFGDYVPGFTSVDSLSGQLKLAAASIYLIVGLGILGMGINLLVAAFVLKYRSIGRKLGVVETKGDLNGDGIDDADGEALALVKGKGGGGGAVSGFG